VPDGERVQLVEQTGVVVDDFGRAGRREVGEPRCHEGPQRRLAQAPLIEEGTRCRHPPVFPLLCDQSPIPISDIGGLDVEQALTRLGQEGRQEAQRCDALPGALDVRAGENTGVAVQDQMDVDEILEEQGRVEIVDVRVIEIDGPSR